MLTILQMQPILLLEQNARKPFGNPHPVFHCKPKRRRPTRQHKKGSHQVTG